MSRTTTNPSLPFLLVFLFAAIAASAAGVGAQEPTPASEPQLDAAVIQSTQSTSPPGRLLVPVRLKASSGALPADLAAKDFELIIAGETQRIDSFLPAGEGEPWRIVLFFDTAMTSGDERRRAALALSEQAAKLTGLGSVEIVRTDPAPRVVLPPSEDPTAVEAALTQTVLGTGGGDSLRALRKRYYQRLLHLRQRRDLESGGDEAIVELIGQAVRDEVALVTRRQDMLLTWLAERETSGARQALILVSGGYDLEPRLFYLAQLPEDLRGAAIAATAARPLERATSDWATGVAALGWLTVPLQLEPAEELAATEQDLAYDRHREASADAGAGDSPAPPAWQTTSLRKIRSRLLGGEEEPEPQGPLLLAPSVALEDLAAATGGQRVALRQALPALLDSLSRTVVLGFQPSDFEAERPLTVRSRRAGVEAESRLWSGGGVPTAVSAARARRLLAGDDPATSLRVAASLRSRGGDESTIEARADLGSVAARRAEQAGDGILERPLPIRLTIAQGSADAATSLSFETRTVADPTQPFAASLPLTMTPGSDRVAVLVEALDGSGWGGVLAANLGAADLGAADLGAAETADIDAPLELDELDALSEALFLPKDKPIRLLPPSNEVLRGKVRVQALVSSDDVAQVDFFLDGERVERSRKAPFEARLRLGNLPRPRTLRVVAYDAAGQELGDDTLSINDLGRGFRVRIVEPLPGRRTGAVNVKMDLNIPVDRRLDRLELSWNERRVATLYGPPFSHRVVIPADNPAGFIRAVAFLDDGRSIEDVVFLNQRDFADKVQIRLVELYTVVTDRDGRPVEDLTVESFTVREEGQVQEIAGFDDAGDLPLTLGLTVDSSASMFVKLPIVQQAAGDFVRGFLSGRDRAFLVDFDTEPRMVRAMTSDLYRVVDGLESLQADGDTHLWESIVYSLMELQGSAGKKALVVFSDGAEEEEALSFKTCQRFAQRLGIPIYLIVLHPGIARGDDLTASVKSFTKKLEKLAADTGGRVYFIPNTDEVEGIYRQIDRELRSQYLLTYYSEARTEGDEEWRPVEVEVDGKGLEARTISGYFPTY